MDQELIFLNPVIQIFQELREKIDPQIQHIKDDLSKQAKKDLYYYTLDLEIKNRLSLKLMIEIFIYLELNHNLNEIQKFRQQFQHIHFEEITFISIGQNVNKKQQLKQLFQNNMDIFQNLNYCLEQMVQMNSRLNYDIEQLSYQIKNCNDQKNKKVLVNQRYRKNQNIYFIELLIYTLQNLKLIYEIVFLFSQNQKSINDLQQQLSTQIYNQTQFGMYIRTESKGRRDKWFLKIQLFQLICLIFVLNTVKDSAEYIDFEIEHSNIIINHNLELQSFAGPKSYNLNEIDQTLNYTYLIFFGLFTFLLIMIILLKKHIIQIIQQVKQYINRIPLYIFYLRISQIK
ncbi:hypothetical protein ABPG74_003470 [Tetrahymena malaccensis]